MATIPKIFSLFRKSMPTVKPEGVSIILFFQRIFLACGLGIFTFLVVLHYLEAKEDVVTYKISEHDNFI